MKIGDVFEVFVTSNLKEIGAAAWDTLSAGRPFQSARWYAYGAQVMDDCQPFYILLYRDHQPVARGTCYRVRNEPLPVSPLARAAVRPFLLRRPLLIFRSPLSNSSGLVLPEPPLLDAALTCLLKEARAIASQQKCSFILCDYLNPDETHASWPSGYVQMTLSDPGTRMQVGWDSFEAYLEAGDKKDRQHYRRSLREAEKLGIRIEKHATVPDIESALALIRAEEKKHGTAPNPWVRGMLENIQSIGGTYLAATIGERLVGCGLLLYDGNTQLAAALGLAEDVPYAYFQLLYTSLQEAFERRIQILRWGSGAYDVKRRLGFAIEMNNDVTIAGIHPLSRFILKMTAQTMKG